jgi:hypothetical protein
VKGDRAAFLLLLIVCTNYCCVSAFAGYWGVDTLSNDGAFDFLRAVEQGGGIGQIRRALADALSARTYLDDEQAARGLAAAELVAGLIGNPSQTLPDSGKKWAAAHAKDVDSDLIKVAVEVVHRVANGSEVRELMEEDNPRYLNEWESSVKNLEMRLTIAHIDQKDID